MVIKIHTIGGYNEVGKNMTALEIDEDVILFDAGLFLPAIVGVSEKERILTEKGMRNLGALPDDIYLEKHGLRQKVRALLISHAHLDHVGAVPYIAPRYNVPVIGTPYTIEVLKVLMEDSNQKIRNRVIPVHLNGSYIIRGRRNSYKVEFINITHSTLQCAIVAVHTPYGIVMYANDYKLDNSPVLGEKPNYARLRELSRIGVKALIVDCLYAPDDRKTPSEKIARGLLEDVLFTTDNRKSGIIITTFSSHIARLKTISEFGRRLNREVVFLGRSLIKYVTAAHRVSKLSFINQIRLLNQRKQIQNMLKRINRERERYLVVCTGHQGEPGSVLDRISRHQLSLRLSQNDHVIFSSKTIPTPINEENRQQLERRLKKHHARIFDNVHCSGHGGREDLRDLINLLKPEHIIPSHGDVRKLTAGASLAVEMGYKLNKTVHVLQNGQMLNLT
jgi:ribonuclease J